MLARRKQDQYAALGSDQSIKNVLASVTMSTTVTARLSVVLDTCWKYLKMPWDTRFQSIEMDG